MYKYLSFLSYAAMTIAQDKTMYVIDDLEKPTVDKISNFKGLSKTKGARRYKAEIRVKPKIGRNEICPKCDSGKKYKNCCGK